MGILVAIVLPNLPSHIKTQKMNRRKVIVSGFQTIKRYLSFVKITKLLEKHAQILVRISVTVKTLDARMLKDPLLVLQRILVAIVLPHLPSHIKTKKINRRKVIVNGSQI